MSLFLVRLDGAFNFRDPIRFVVQEAHRIEIQLAASKNGGSNGEMSEIIVILQGLLQSWGLPQLAQGPCDAKDILAAASFSSS